MSGIEKKFAEEKEKETLPGLPLLTTATIGAFQDERNILITGQVNSELMVKVVLLLREFDKKDPNAPITLYIDSPGGSVNAGLVIVDYMRLCKAPVYTVCMSLAASMGAVIFSAGEKGHRYMFEHSQLMIHQPWQGLPDHANESELSRLSEEMTNTRNKLEELLAEASGKDLKTIHEACEPDNYLDADEAIALGLCDEIIRRGE